MRGGSRIALLLGLSVALSGCSDDDLSADGSGSASSEASEAGDGDGEAETGETEESGETGRPPWEPTEPFVREVQVTLDGEPVEGAVVAQGGNPMRWTTDAEGRVEITVDPTVPGFEIYVTAAHPEARTLGGEIVEDPAPLQIALARYDTSDNLEYVFNDPGRPDDNGTTAKCAHCHKTINADWYGSPHRQSASNPVVQDVYAGAAASLADQVSCEAAGGQWWPGIDPATGDATTRCYIGQGALPDLNADCGQTGSCDGVATEFGDCADCHAPAIDGELGGRDLLEAGGIAGENSLEGDRAYQYGVHCDLCHKVSDLHLEEKPGVGGRLQITRPSEPASGALGGWLPLTFAPYDDVSHIRMGASPRSFFETADICAGCHELSEAPRLPGASIDETRWPEGELPMHTTYSEWQAGLLGDVTPCQACHMPPDPEALNSADLNGPENAGIGSGFIREPGAVRQHVWGGPRTPESGLLDGAAALFVEHQQNAGELEVAVTLRNAGCGHQLPTGEPMRSVMVLVDATCDGTALDASGGEVVPVWGGARMVKASGEDWSLWPGAEVGQVVRVIERPGGFHDYTGYGRFGDGSFDAEAKGMPVEHFVGMSTIVSVDGDTVTLDQPLPPGDFAYLGDAEGEVDGQALNLAGAPGFAFARVMADPEGSLMVPHHRAVDVVSDNRLAPQAEWTSLHRFAVDGACAEPQVRARVVYRPLPPALRAERGWERGDEVIEEVVK